MEYRDYEVKWSVRGMDFNYSGTETVWGSDSEQAETRAKNEVNRKTCLSKFLIEITSVAVV